MYIRDDIADKSILENKKIRDAIRGTSAILVAPGHAAYVLTNFMLMLGWMGCSIGVYGTSGESKTVLVYCLGASLVDVTLVSFIGYQVVSGYPRARRHMYVYSIGLAVLCTSAVLIALTYGGRAALVVSVGGLLASLVAIRCLSGPSYAMLAAFFRAKRASRESVGGRANDLPGA
jgi:hypothetical protein